MQLPKNEKSFHYKRLGEKTGREYEGTFTTRCVLNFQEKRLLEIEKSTITADLSNPTSNLSAIAEVVANLRIRLVEAPDWFKQCIRSLDLLDEEIYFEIYGKCLECEREWMDEIKAKSLGEQKAETQAPQENLQS
jgi:hypothetical protein